MGSGWLDKGDFDKEQDWQDREQSCICTGKKEFRDECFEEVDGRNEAGSEATRHHWIRCHQWQDSTREGTLCQGEVHPREVMLESVDASNLCCLFVLTHCMGDNALRMHEA